LFMRNRIMSMRLLGFLFFSVYITDCQSEETSKEGVLAQSESYPLYDAYDPFIDSNLAEGFDFPVGDEDGKGSYQGPSGKQYHGWYIATRTAERYSLGIHTGENWNGKGGGNTDLGQPVYSIATGVVVAAENYAAPWGNVVVVQYRYLENHKIQQIYGVFAHLDKIAVKKGEVLSKRQQLGTIGTGGGAYPAHLHIEIRKQALADYSVSYWLGDHGKNTQWLKKNYQDVFPFIHRHRQTTSPVKEPTFLLVIKHLYKLYYFEYGKLTQRYEIALSQSPKGHKVKQGDLRLPEGAYNIIQKTTGPFSGKIAAWFGSGWMRINYPNTYDIEAGYQKAWISKSQRDKMTTAWLAGKEPNKKTKLGGGIGIHGWNGEWFNNQDRALTWGCISMHNSDLDVFIKKVPLQTKILIIP